MCLALRGEGYALLYTHTGRKLDVQLDKLGFAKASASWFDPRTGATTSIAVVEKKTRHTFDPPGEEAPGNDWVLVLEKESSPAN
jgi:hypothetical protein